MEPTCVPRHKPTLGLELYDISVNILIKLCPQVPAQFFENARYLFKVLHYVSSEGRTELITKQNFKKVHAVLHKCRSDVKVHVGYMDMCLEKVYLISKVVAKLIW
jgi:hypothetical protein